MNWIRNGEEKIDLYCIGEEKIDLYWHIVLKGLIFGKWEMICLAWNITKRIYEWINLRLSGMSSFVVIWF